MDDQQTESIERATLCAVSPEAVEEIDGWLLPFDSGTVGRAKSAVPLRHAAPGLETLAQIEARYRARGMACQLRLPEDSAFFAWHAALLDKGYQRYRPTHVQLAPTHVVRAVTTLAPADLADAPDAAWRAIFLGEGFDPVDGAIRVAALSRAAGSLYASVCEHGVAVAAGAGAFSHGWASVHGMRTLPGHRGQGLAGRVLAGIAGAALRGGLGQMFLQVEASNAPAIALYRRAGFKTAWTYAYWRRG